LVLRRLYLLKANTPPTFYEGCSPNVTIYIFPLMNTFSPGYALPEKIPASMAAAEDLIK
jgi:hypothetical protein